MKTIYEVGQRGKLVFMLNLHPEGEEDNLPMWAWGIIALVVIGIVVFLAIIPNSR